MRKNIFIIFISIIILYINAFVPKNYAVNYNNISRKDDSIFQWIITESSLVPAQRQATYFSYLSIGEISKKIPGYKILDVNKNWNSFIINYSDVNTRNLLKTSIRKILEKSDGIFLDNIDSYYFFDKPPYNKSIDSLNDILDFIKTEFPDKKIIINRGFEVVKKIGNKIDGFLFENFFRAYDFDKKIFIKNQEISIIKEYVQEIHKDFPQLPVLVIEYFKEKTLNSNDFAEESDYRKLGLIPYFSTISLDKTYYRKTKKNNRFIGFIDDKEPRFSDMHALVQLPLEYNGIVLDIFNYDNVPEDIDMYSGVIIFDYGQNYEDDIYDKVFSRITMDHKLIVLGRVPSQLLNRRFKDKKYHVELSKKIFNVNINNQYMDFEVDTDKYNLYSWFEPFKSNNTTILLGDDKKTLGFFDKNNFVFTTEFFIKKSFSDYDLTVNLFKAFGDFLNIDYPVPDLCTLSGKRLGFVHFDADGFNSISNIEPDKYCLEVMNETILSEFSQIPASYSFITSFLEFDKNSDRLKQIVKDLKDYKNVEIASHSFSHPFIMDKNTVNEDYGHNLKIPGYKLDYKKELRDSIDYLKDINPSKVKDLFFWTGDCAPTENILKIADSYNIYSINGGDSVLDNKRNSYSSVKPSFVQVGRLKQIYAQSCNEFIYTKGWTENYNGYRDVIQTFKNTGTPYLLKPVNIYTHFYLVENIPGLKSIKAVFNYVRNSDFINIFTSDYVKTVKNFIDYKVEKEGEDSYILYNNSLRSVKNFQKKGIDLNKCENVTGFNYINGIQYISLGSKKVSRIVFSDQNKLNKISLITANKMIDSLELKDNSVFIKTPFNYDFIKIKMKLRFSGKEKELALYENNRLKGYLKKSGEGEFEI